MSQPRATFSMTRILVIAVVVLTIVALSLGLVVLTGPLSPRRVEKILFNSAEWSGVASSGDATSIDLSISNIGADDVILDKVWINGTLIQSSEWVCLPSLRLKPGDQGAIHIAPTLIVFKGKGTVYEITIGTEVGNAFPCYAINNNPLFWDVGQLTFTNFAWGANNANAQLTVTNTGGVDVSVAHIRIDGAAPATVAPSLDPPYLLPRGNSVTFTVTRTGGFVSGISYEFTVVTGQGHSFGPYTRTAP